ncbi:MAG: hypothetical protein JO114_03370 [Planctomycetaceae bacterium]|nr:hypothetical protein [Planctomycetaceae bacterium]MBV8311126.1 hypothetical protein [Planctomycetaceae bacterium]
MSEDYDSILFPYGESNLIPGMSVDTSKYGGRPVKHAAGLLNQGDFRPASKPWPFKVVQAAPPRPKMVLVTFCPSCGGQEIDIPPCLKQCRKCHRQRRA